MKGGQGIRSPQGPLPWVGWACLSRLAEAAMVGGGGAVPMSLPLEIVGGGVDNRPYS
jgi:hypothetical protein